jgi:hypothetical protein
MNVEIVEFYLIKRNTTSQKLEGSLRVRLTDFGIQLLGIYVTKSKTGWFFRTPHGRGTDPKTGATVYFPFLTFDDKQQHTVFMQAVREKGIPFIEKKLADLDAAADVAAESTNEEVVINKN